VIAGLATMVMMSHKVNAAASAIMPKVRIAFAVAHADFSRRSPRSLRASSPLQRGQQQTGKE